MPDLNGACGFPMIKDYIIFAIDPILTSSRCVTAESSPLVAHMATMVTVVLDLLLSSPPTVECGTRTKAMRSSPFSCLAFQSGETLLKDKS